MSGAQELLDRLAQIGATVETAGDHLIVRAGMTAVPAALVNRLRRMKAEVLATLATTGAAPPSSPVSLSSSGPDWRARHQEALRFWNAFHDADEAAAIAWGEMVILWHRRYGKPAPLGTCGGCRRPVGNSNVLRLGDGTNVHSATLDCLIAYGAWWRGAASQALVAMGLTPRMQIDPSVKDTP